MMKPSQKRTDDQRMATLLRQWEEDVQLKKKRTAESKAGRKKPAAESKGGKKTGDVARGKKAAQR